METLLKSIDSFFGIFVKVLESILFYSIAGFPIIIII